jgi:hypothetical protein
MWKPEHRLAADRRGLRYPSDLTDAEWGIVARKTALWLPGMPRLCIAATISSSVKVRVLGDQREQKCRVLFQRRSASAP